MIYKHILVAVALSEDSPKLVKRASQLASALNSRMSLVYIDVNYAELYTGLIDINIAETQARVNEEARNQLQELADNIDYPIAHTFVGSGDLSQEIKAVVEEHNIDLVVCGHHQDFWSKLLSSSNDLINNAPTDLLVVPADKSTEETDK